jgi:hypothetical protein
VDLQEVMSKGPFFAMSKSTLKFLFAGSLFTLKFLFNLKKIMRFIHFPNFLLPQHIPVRSTQKSGGEVFP